MSEQEFALQNQQNFSTQQDEDNGGMQITDILEIFVHNWKWFVLSVFVCLAGAWIYLKRTTPVYTRSAQILIKEEGKNGGYSGKVDWFATLGMGSSVINVKNEIAILKSPSTFIEVVKRLELNTTYELEGKWHNTSLYGDNLPVKVKFLDLARNKDGEIPCRLDLTLKKGGQVILSNMQSFAPGAVPSTKKLSLHVGQTVRTPLGRVQVTIGPAMAAYANAEEDLLIHVTHTSILAASKGAAGGLGATLNDKENSIVDLTYNDTDVRRAEDILQTLIDAYNDAWVEDKNKMTVATNDFIMERLKVIQSELSDVDHNISSYKSTHLMADPSATASLYIADANTADKKADEINNQIYMAQYLRTFINKEANKFSLLPVNSGIGASSIETQIAQYNQQLLDRNRIVANSNVENQVVKDADVKLSQMRGAIITSIDNQINLLSAQLNTTRRTESKANAGIASSPQQAQYLLSVERQQKVKESLYLFLLQKREENELSLAYTAYNTRVITPPMGGGAPVAPQSNRILLMALLLGLAIPGGILYLIEVSNSRVRGRKDIEKLSIPFVGEIPFVGKRERKGLRSVLEALGILKAKKVEEQARQIVVQSHKRDIANEAFRVVRTNLDFMTGADDQKVIMVTSSNPSSGKSYISANLAASFALKEKRVLLIDFDLRRASSSLLVGSPEKGVSNYLSGKCTDWHSLIAKVEGVENMDILPVGSLPPNPAELLSNKNTARLFEEVRAEYDLIFVDCPPVEIVADASIIAKYVDQTVFVVRVGLMEREMLSVVEKYYRTNKYKGLSLLLNGSLSAYGRYGYHRYGYRYGYGYGYGNTENYISSK